MTSFAESVGHDAGRYADLHAWSVGRPDEFWAEVWEWCGVLGDPGAVAFDPGDGDDLRSARFFPEGRLNFAANVLRGRGSAPAILFAREDGLRREWTWDDLRVRVGEIRRSLLRTGIEPGDRIAAWIPNVPEAVAVFLAATSIGAAYSSTSPDFGARGVVDRLGQIEPRILFAVDAYLYGGKAHDCLARLAEIRDALPSVERVVVLPYVEVQPRLDAVADAVLWDDFLDGGRPGRAEEPEEAEDPELFPFDQPLVVLYSSGTTGAPKCIVHRAGGILLKHLEEHKLHADVRPGDRVFYFTTTGWMMWNWLTSALASEATIVLYDGSPFQPHAGVLFDLADETGVTHFGTSAKWIDAVAKEGLVPAQTHDLSKLRTVLSTGSPLAPGGFDYVYESVKADVHLTSISGGTDLCGSFVMGNPVMPVWRGEIQCAALGMDVRVLRSDGSAADVGEKGELVCATAFPSMPLCFWGDEGGARYASAYFERFPGIWSHGDYVSRTEHGGYVIFGRSDATLNPGGVRIGTAEIYRIVEQLPEVAESIVVGQEWDSDTRVVLFVRLADGADLTADLEAEIRDRVRREATPRHVPAKILAVDDIPRTRSGKITELAVRDAIHGRPVGNTEALANPEALDGFRNRPELAE